MPDEAQRAAGGEEEFLRQGMTYHQGWLHYFIARAPAEDWRAVDVPVLALFGEPDVQVRSALNVPRLRASLASNEATERALFGPSALKTLRLRRLLKSNSRP